MVCVLCAWWLRGKLNMCKSLDFPRYRPTYKRVQCGSKSWQSYLLTCAAVHFSQQYSFGKHEPGIRNVDPSFLAYFASNHGEFRFSAEARRTETKSNPCHERLFRSGGTFCETDEKTLTDSRPISFFVAPIKVAACTA